MLIICLFLGSSATIDEVFVPGSSDVYKSTAWMDRLDDLISQVDKCAKSRIYVKVKEEHEGLDRRGTALILLPPSLLLSYPGNNQSLPISLSSTRLQGPGLLQ